MPMVMLTSNDNTGECDFGGITHAYFVVITTKPFEAKWTAFKTACREHFVTYHIVFLTPLVESPLHIRPFLFHYGKMLGYPEEEMMIYG